MSKKTASFNVTNYIETDNMQFPLFLFSRKIFTYTLNKNVNEPSNKPFGNVVTIKEGSWEEHTGQKVDSGRSVNYMAQKDKIAQNTNFVKLPSAK